MNIKQNFLETVKWGAPEYLSIDFGPIVMVREPGAKVFDAENRDLWGVKWGVSEYEEFRKPCVIPGYDVITDIEKWKEQIILPDIEGKDFDYGKAAAEAARIDRTENMVCLACSGGTFEKSHFLLGFENCLAYLLLEPELMGEVMDAITDLRIALLKKTYEATKFEAIFFHDDWGSKHSLFFSPETWRTLIKPREKRIVEAIKSCDPNILFIHHSDTFLEPLIGEMSEIGIDVWQGCIPQNDIVSLQKKYKGKVAFMGGIDIAKIDRKNFDEEEIRAEVRRAIDTYAPYGGFVPGIPSAAALYDEVQKIYMDEVTKYGKEYSEKHFKTLATV